MDKGKRKVVLASRNPDKIRELQELLADSPFTVVGAGEYPGLPEVIEDGTTILGNARRKAMVTAAFTGEIALADDTSFQVRELNDWPDIFAARFSGSGATYASNAQLVLDLMREVPDEARQARFSTACVWLDPQPDTGDGLDEASFPVLGPASRRWVRNPWFGTRPFHPDSSPVPGEWDYWNTLSDRRAAWREYATRMLADKTNYGGHDAEALAEVGRSLLASCPDSPLASGQDEEAANGGGPRMRLPDPELWTAPGPGGVLPDVSPFYPSGLPHDAPGRNLAQPLWLEIDTTGTLVGAVTREPIGGGGFGYDPIFRPTGLEATLAELDPEQKNTLSHRGRALRRMLKAVHRAYGL